MKEIMAVIRPNMTNATKDALEAAGFPAYTCTKVRGRGKNRLILPERSQEIQDTDYYPRD